MRLLNELSPVPVAEKVSAIMLLIRGDHFARSVAKRWILPAGLMNPLGFLGDLISMNLAKESQGLPMLGLPMMKTEGILSRIVAIKGPLITVRPNFT